MPLPATVDALDGFKWSPWKNARQGPFEVGGNLYCALTNPTLDVLSVFKSTDGGNTWAEMDVLNRKAIAGATGDQTIGVVLDGTQLVVAYSLATGFLAIAKFATATDTWGASVAGGPGVVPDLTGYDAHALACRGPNDYVVAYNSGTETIMGKSYRRVSVSFCTAGAWGTAVVVEGAVQDDQDLVGLAVGSSSRVHVLYRIGSTTASNLRHRSFLSTNALGTAATITTSGPAPGTGYVGGVPISYVDGADTKVVVPWVSSTTDLIVGRFTSADAPTFTVQTVSAANDPEFITSNPGAVAVDGTTVHAFWPDAATDDLWRDNDAGTGTWGTDVEHRDAITVGGVNVAKISNAIGILYDDGGVVKFDTLTFGPPTQSITGAGGIASGEAFGTGTIVAGSVNVSPGGIASAEAFGTPAVQIPSQAIQPGGISSGEAFGTGTLVRGAVNVSTSSIGSAETFGTTAVTRGAVSVSPPSVPSAEAFGTPTVVPGAASIAPGGISSGEAIGAATVTAGAVSVSPGSIASAEAVSTPAVAPAPHSIAPGSIGSAEAFGTGTIVAGWVNVSPGGIPSAETFGAATLAPAALSLAPTSISSAEAFGTPTVAPAAGAISPGSIGSSEAFGTSALLPGPVTLQGTGIPSSETFGALAVARGAVSIGGQGIPSAEAIGAPAVTAGGATVGPSSIPSSETFGTAALDPGAVAITLGGIPSAETFGTGTLVAGAVALSPTGIPSAEAFGAPAVVLAGAGLLTRPTRATVMGARATRAAVMGARATRASTVNPPTTRATPDVRATRASIPGYDDG